MEEIKKKESNENIIAAAKERLRWYTEASIEEFDENEVEALVNLLNTLEPPKVRTEQEKVAELERFQAYCNMRAEEGRLMDEETIKRVTSNVEQKANNIHTREVTKISMERDVVKESATSKSKEKKTIRAFIYSHKSIAAVAAVFIMLLVVGGSFGAVNAGKGNGFFYWLSKDDEGVTMLTSPENMGSELSVATDSIYNTMDEVPEQYLKYLVDKDELESLGEYEFQEVRVRLSDPFSVVQQVFVTTEGGNSVALGIKIYINEAILLREEYQYKETLETGMKELVEGELVIIEECAVNEEYEYAVLFYNDNKQYFVEGDCSVNELITIAEEYQKFIMMFGIYGE